MAMTIKLQLQAHYTLQPDPEVQEDRWRSFDSGAYQNIILGSPPPIAKGGAPSRWCFPLHFIEPAPPFRIPHWLIVGLTRMGLEPLRLDIQSQPAAEKPLVVVAEFPDRVTGEAIHVALGTCMQSQSPGTLAHWAKVQLGYHYPWAAEPHDCCEHHVKAWPRWTKEFGDAEGTVRLSFSSCKLMPKHTLVVHVELEGRVYGDLKIQERRVTIARRSETEDARRWAIRLTTTILSRPTNELEHQESSLDLGQQ
ncbi:hypothetical protein V8D89_003464 [Ganoderma adspersum]